MSTAEIECQHVWKIFGERADEAMEACEPVRGQWAVAARDGVRDPVLARAAQRVLGALRGAGGA